MSGLAFGLRDHPLLEQGRQGVSRRGPRATGLHGGRFDLPGGGIANAETVIREWIETARELGRPVPEPRGRLMYA